jgi:hypothetical protein
MEYRDTHNGPAAFYLVHYFGWSDKWNEWREVEHLRPYAEEGREPRSTTRNPQTQKIAQTEEHNDNASGTTSATRMSKTVTNKRKREVDARDVRGTLTLG